MWKWSFGNPWKHGWFFPSQKNKKSKQKWWNRKLCLFIWNYIIDDKVTDIDQAANRVVCREFSIFSKTLNFVFSITNKDIFLQNWIKFKKPFLPKASLRFCSLLPSIAKSKHYCSAFRKLQTERAPTAAH